MKRTIPLAAVFTWLCLTTAGASSQTVIEDCPNGRKPAVVDLEAIVSASPTGCPLLEQENLRKLVDKNMSGTEFAYPFPGSCLSGVIIGGTIETKRGSIHVTGTTESAQRYFPEALAVSPSLGGVFLTGMSLDGIPFASGAAVTAVILKGVNQPLDLTLLMSDRFTIRLDSYPLIDTEDFEVVDAIGASITGRLTGIAQVFNSLSDPIEDAPFTVQGKICMK